MGADGDRSDELCGVGKAKLLMATYEIAITEGNLLGIIGTKQNQNIKAGFVAEEMHAETFNLDAIDKGAPERAYTDRHDDFSNTGYTRNGVSDIVITDGEQVMIPNQSKYFQSPRATANAHRILGQDGLPKYQGQRSLVPSDQLEGVRAEAHRTRLKNEGPYGRPAVAAAAAMVEKGASDRISHGNVQSSPLSLGDAKAIARDPHGPERRAPEEAYIRTVLEAVKAEKEATGRTFDPKTLYEGDAIERLINNGRVDDVLSAMDENGMVEFVWVFQSTDPDLTLDQLDQHETTRDWVRGIAKDIMSVPVSNISVPSTNTNDHGDEDDGLDDEGMDDEDEDEDED